MTYDEDKLDEMAPAILWLNAWTERRGAARAWKAMPREVADRLHEEGYIGDPRSKAKSVRLTAESHEHARRLFEEHSLNDHDGHEED